MKYRVTMGIKCYVDVDVDADDMRGAVLLAEGLYC